MQILYIIGAIIFMVFFFGFCIFVHELGHFLAAKWRGLHIIAFSIGFRKVWAFKHNGIEYRIGWIPCGGYVDLPQIDATGKPTTADGKELPKAKPIDRIITAFAGPLFNVLFGFLLGVVVWLHGLPQDTPRMHTIIVDTIEKGSPEYKAGLREGDAVFSLNGRKFNCTWAEFVRDVILTVGHVELGVRRGQDKFIVRYQPVENNEAIPGEKIAYPFFRPKIPIVMYPEYPSSAAAAGLRAGDILREVNGKKISSFEEFELALSRSEGKPLKLRVERSGKTVDIVGIVPKKLSEGYKIGILHSGTLPFEVVDVRKDTPAFAAGLMKGDIISAVDGRELTAPGMFTKIVDSHKGAPVVLTVKRGNEVLEKKITPQLFKDYSIGVRLTVFDYPTPLKQFTNVIMLSYRSVRGVLAGLAQKMGLSPYKTTLKPSHFSGPIGIGRVIYISVYRGSLIRGIHFIVIITFSLGLLNLLPIPVLDGGHILLALFELIFRRPLPAGLVQPVTVVFIVLLISFMLFVSYSDTRRVYFDIFGRSSSGEEVHPETGEDVKVLEARDEPDAAAETGHLPGASNGSDKKTQEPSTENR